MHMYIDMCITYTVYTLTHTYIYIFLLLFINSPSNSGPCFLFVCFFLILSLWLSLCPIDY